MQNMRGCYERPQNNINIEKIKEHQMSLEQTIKDTVIAESHDLDGRLQQLVRAGLMPANTIPILRKAIGKVQGGMTLQGAERDVMANFINSMMFIVLGDDTVFNKARAGAKGYAAEEVELDENAPIVAHLQKRYGDNIRKSHVRSAANDFGVDASKLAKAVRTKLGKNMLDEEDDGWYTHSQMHGSKKSEKHPKGISAAEWKSGIRWHHGKNKRINIKEAKEKTEYDYEGDMAMGQLKSIIANSQRMHDMLSDDTNLPEWVQSKITLAEDYISTASNYMQGEMNEEKMPFDGPYRKVGERKDKYGNTIKNAAKHLAKKAMNAQTQKNEEVQIDELSKKTLGSYVKKASGAEQPKNVMSPKNVPLTNIAAYQGDSETGHFGKRFNQHTYDKAERLRKNRETGIKRAVDKLTKEEVEQMDELSVETMKSAKEKLANKAYDAHMDDNKMAARNFAHRALKVGSKIKSKERSSSQMTREEVEMVYEANIQPTAAKSRSHIGNISHPTTNHVAHPSSGKEIGLITKQPDGKYHAHPSSVKLSHSQGGTFDTKDQAHQHIRDAHAKAIKTGTLSDRWKKQEKLPQFAKEEVEQEEYTFADYLNAALEHYNDEEAVNVANEAYNKQDISLFIKESQQPEA